MSTSAHPRRSGRPLATVVAPIALLLAVSIIVLIANDAGWIARSEATHHIRPPAKAAVAKHHAAKPPVKASTAVERVTYHVQPGDTLGSIATRFRTTLAQIEQLNPGVDSSRLTIGQPIRLR